MPSSFPRIQPLLLIFWILAIATIPIYISFDPPGWDMKVYSRAAHSLKVGRDPYADGLAIQKEFYANPALHTNDQAPLQYLYPPLTLPLLRIAGAINIRHRFWQDLYWFLYVAGILAQTFVGFQFAKSQERPVLRFLAPGVIFFPGLLQHDNFLGGNISFIFYGAILAAALVGWRHERWLWFYLGVLAASCCKTPWLTLLAIPILSARKQWLPACGTAAVGVALFAIQPWIWPTYFRNFLQAIQFEFVFHGFGVSPAGAFANTLFRYGHPYALPSAILYLVYAPIVCGLLFRFSRGYLNGKLSFEQWIPVMLLGVFLLNPRIKDYDVAPLTIPMALIAWRFCAVLTTSAKTTALLGAVLFVLANVVALTGAIGSDSWNLISCFLLVSLFAGGCWNLFKINAPKGEIPLSLPQATLRS